VRALPVVLALVVHTAALGVYVMTQHAALARWITKPVAQVEIVEPVEAALFEVTFLDDDTGNAVSDQPGDRPRPATRARVTTEHAVATAGASEIPPTSSERASSTKPTTKRFTLSMRTGPQEPTFHRPGSDGISDEMIEAMVEGRIPVKIANLPGAQADADYNKANGRLRSGTWVDKATPEQVAAARLDRAAAKQAKEAVELVEQKDGTYTSNKTNFTAKVNRDGTVALTSKPNWQQKSLFFAEFDATAAWMRARGDDAYASEKRAFLDRTRDQRVEIGKRYRSAQLAKSAQLMTSNLARLWAMTSDPATRKEEVFALWDDCAETGDEELLEGAAEARRILINWVHAKHLELTAEELAAFNARRQSKAVFAP
jgi:hypothetical protein